MLRACAVLLVLSGCGGCDHHGARADAWRDVDSRAIDSLLADVAGPSADASVDALADGGVDACGFELPDDAAVVVASPHCVTAPTVLLDVAPDRISTISQVGGVLYAIADHVDSTNGHLLGSRLIAVDLTSGTQTTLLTSTTESMAVKRPAEGWVYIVKDKIDNSAGMILRVRPGVTPEVVVQGIPPAISATQDANNVYWNETDGQQMWGVYARSLCGGPTTRLMTGCDGLDLAVDDQYVYCAPYIGSSSLQRAPKDGSSPAVGLGGQTYPWTALLRVGTKLYGTDAGNMNIYVTALPDGPITTFSTTSTVARFGGLAASNGYLYGTTSGGVYRVNLTSKAYSMVAPSDLDQNPIVWNDQLFSPANDSQVLHCIN